MHALPMQEHDSQKGGLTHSGSAQTQKDVSPHDSLRSWRQGCCRSLWPGHESCWCPGRCVTCCHQGTSPCPPCPAADSSSSCRGWAEGCRTEMECPCRSCDLPPRGFDHWGAACWHPGRSVPLQEHSCQCSVQRRARCGRGCLQPCWRRRSAPGWLHCQSRKGLCWRPRP